MKSEVYCNGPFTVAFEVYDNFFGYSSGVYNEVSGNVAGGHAVTLVGFGTLNSEDYWELMNSWGSGWGDGGFFKMLRGVNLASIESWGSSAAHVARTQGSWVYDDWAGCSPESAPPPGQGLTAEIFYFPQGDLIPDFAGKTPDLKRVVPRQTRIPQP
ncbi:CTSB [Symbiodinium natans]|uniref:CTSB protein n=1 Tax=Symbiodinium natans TaxID=878477 RepID=A0A812J0M4_9DINO|nr:CTSB [Symbiodinium natans]